MQRERVLFRVTILEISSAQCSGGLLPRFEETQTVWIRQIQQRESLAVTCWKSAVSLRLNPAHLIHLTARLC